MRANIQRDAEQLIADIREEFDVEYFVETGTNVGQTAEWASEQFDQVVTIEMDADVYEQALDERGHIDNIEFVKGMSQEELEHVVPELDSPAVFHLDAHCGGKWAATAGESLERSDVPPCPVLEELDVIAESDYSHYVFIDDARVFTSPRREPFDMDEWPNIQEVIHKLEEVDPDYEVLIYKDEIIAVPPDGIEFVRERVRDFKTEARTPLTRLKLKVLNKVWYHASLSGPTRDY